MTLANDSSYFTSQVLRNGLTATYDNILSINSSPSELIGVYSCIVQDSLGRKSETSTIQVKGEFTCFLQPSSTMASIHRIGAIRIRGAYYCGRKCHYHLLI